MHVSRDSRAAQSAGMRSTSSARLSSGAASRAAASASSENDDSSGRTRLALAPGYRFDLDVARDAVRDRPARDCRKRWEWFAGKGGRVRAARVELGELCPGERVGAAAAVGRAIECVVVQQERDAVAG